MIGYCGVSLLHREKGGGEGGGYFLFVFFVGARLFTFITV
jgi:hypothetical protein